MENNKILIQNLLENFDVNDINNKYLPKLSQNLLEILDDEEYYDITIEVGNDPYVKIFRSHMVILYYRSPYLRRILSINKKDDGTLVHIKLPNILPETFQQILRYIYGGKLSLKDLDVSSIIKILVAADELGIQELITYLQSFLIFLIENDKVNWTELNFDLIYQTSFKNDSFLNLQKYYTYLVSKEPDKIFKSSNFSSISEKLLISIIQNHQMNEIQIWEYVIKWGLAQNPELSSDITNFSKEDFNILKNNLQQFIPFIKFYNLTSKEFSEKVLPYKKILPKELHKNLLNHFLNPNNNNQSIIKEINSKNIDSKVITFQHAELILKWTNINASNTFTSIFSKLIYKEVTTNELNYSFKLLFRGSRDGFTPKQFHEICDNQSHTISIIKIKNMDVILGGYNPIEWKSDGSFGVTKDSFIFSFKGNIENHILGRVIDEKFAIRNNPYHGPSFGVGDLKCDFYSCSCSKLCYETTIESPLAFDVEECEVFQIITNS